MADEDTKRAAHRALVDRILNGTGRASAQQRAHAYRNDGLPPPLDTLLGKVATNQKGGTYWPALGGKPTGSLGYDYYSMYSLSGSGTSLDLSIRNPSGADRIRYAWGDTISGGSIYRINVRHSGKAMDVQQPNTDNGARVGQYTYGGNAWQQWQFQDAGSGYWRIISRHSGKCLDVVSASTADGAELVQYTCGAGTNQQFQMVANGSYFQLRARHSGKCVDVPSASTADGVILKQYPCSTGTNQQWSRAAV